MDQNTKMSYIQEIKEALNYSEDSTQIDKEGNLIVRFSDGKKLKVIISELSNIKGLDIKYNVTKVKDGRVVDNCFVLRPDKDPAARRALIEYALATKNLKLREDIFKWMKFTKNEDINLAVEAYKKQIPYKLTNQDGDTGICICGRVTEIIDGFFYCKYCGNKITK